MHLLSGAVVIAVFNLLFELYSCVYCEHMKITPKPRTVVHDAVIL